MPPRDWRIRLQDIYDATSKIVRHTQNMDFKAFAADQWSIDAVLRNLTVIGEAASHIPETTATAYPEIPWAEMRDMRNIVVHEYFGVDIDIVWQTISHDLPDLLPALERLLHSPNR